MIGETLLGAMIYGLVEAYSRDSIPAHDIWFSGGIIPPVCLPYTNSTVVGDAASYIIYEPISAATSFVYVAVALRLSDNMLSVLTLILGIGSFSLHSRDEENARSIDYMGAVLILFALAIKFYPNRAFRMNMLLAMTLCAGFIIARYPSSALTGTVIGSVFLGSVILKMLFVDGINIGVPVVTAIALMAVAGVSKNFYSKIEAICRNDNDAFNDGDVAHAVWHVLTALAIYILGELPSKYQTKDFIVSVLIFTTIFGFYLVFNPGWEAWGWTLFVFSLVLTFSDVYYVREKGYDELYENLLNTPEEI